MSVRYSVIQFEKVWVRVEFFLKARMLSVYHSKITKQLCKHIYISLKKKTSGFVNGEIRSENVNQNNNFFF